MFLRVDDGCGMKRSLSASGYYTSSL